MKRLACLLLAAACGSSSTSSTSTTTMPPAEPAVAVLPDVPFEQLDHDQRAEFMKQKVMPVMEPIFKNHDPKEFAEFSCKTCHGKQAEQGHFDMPSIDLPKLDFKDMSKWDKADLEWMSKEVKPTMAKLLSLAEYAPENPSGFGCQSCHTTQ
jgi:hypothetical protein